MKRESLELGVGLFMLAGIACLGYLSVKLGRMELMGGQYYPVSAEFESVSGLKKGASVEIAGVEVGKVEAIDLNQETARARVRLNIRTNVKLEEDVIASVRTKGIIGDKFIKLKPGGGEQSIKSGGKIRETEAAVDLEELLSKYIHGQVE